MNQGAYLDQYKRTATQTASPLQLVIMLYDGALRFIAAAELAMTNGDRFGQNENIQRAQRIVSELTASLDLEKGAEVASNLFNLYSYCYDQLVQANILDDPTKLKQAVMVLEPLRESWRELDAQVRQGQPDELRLAS